MKVKKKDIEKPYVCLISPTESTEENFITLSECPEARLIFHALSLRFRDAVAFLVSSVFSSHLPPMFLADSAFLVPPFLLTTCQHGPVSGCLPIVGKRGCLPLDSGNS